MAKKESRHLDFIVDRLTNSIVNTISGDSFDTEVSLLKNVDVSQIVKKTDGILTGRLSYVMIGERFISLP